MKRYKCLLEVEDNIIRLSNGRNLDYYDYSNYDLNAMSMYELKELKQMIDNKENKDDNDKKILQELNNLIMMYKVYNASRDPLADIKINDKEVHKKGEGDYI